jgi:RNA recognition motif-containing protein
MMGRTTIHNWEELLKEYLKSEYLNKTDFAKAKGINPSLLHRNSVNWPNKGKGETEPVKLSQDSKKIRVTLLKKKLLKKVTKKTLQKKLRKRLKVRINLMTRLVMVPILVIVELIPSMEKRRFAFCRLDGELIT